MCMCAYFVLFPILGIFSPTLFDTCLNMNNNTGCFVLLMAKQDDGEHKSLWMPKKQAH